MVNGTEYRVSSIADATVESYIDEECQRRLTLPSVRQPILTVVDMLALPQTMGVVLSLRVMVVLSLSHNYQPRKVFALPPTVVLMLATESLLTLTCVVGVLSSLPRICHIKLMVMVVLLLTHINRLTLPPVDSPYW